MAHQTDVHVVRNPFEIMISAEKATDPVCGLKIGIQSSKHVLFRDNETVYFCSRSCKDQYMAPGWKKQKTA